MTKNQTVQVKEAVQAKVVADQHPLEKIIEDPFASMFAATAVTSIAFAFVVSGAWLVSVMLG